MTSDLPSFLTAINFAVIKHKNQVRKNINKDPYVVHVIGVAKHVIESGINTLDILNACILHDTIEDTQTTEEELRHHFGDIATNYVLEVTDDKSLSKSKRKALQIEHSLHMSDGAKVVKLADKLYNLIDLRDNPVPFWSHEYIIGTVVWMKVIANNLVTNVQDKTLLTSLEHMKVIFDNTATEILAKYKIDYENISEEQEILDNYINNLCNQQ